MDSLILKYKHARSTQKERKFSQLLKIAEKEAVHGNCISPHTRASSSNLWHSAFTIAEKQYSSSCGFPLTIAEKQYSSSCGFSLTIAKTQSSSSCGSYLVDYLLPVNVRVYKTVPTVGIDNFQGWTFHDNSLVVFFVDAGDWRCALTESLPDGSLLFASDNPSQT
jgi:hypothetical protein